VMATDPTDHELLLLLRRDVEQLSRQLMDALTQLARGNARFEAIALQEQEVRSVLSTVRQDIARAQMEAGDARKKADDAIALAKSVLTDHAAHLRDVQEDIPAFRTLRREFETQRNYVRAVAVIALALVVEAAKRWLWP